MAHILKEGSNATLKQILNRYHSLILGVAFFMNFAAILFHVVSVESYSDAMRQALSLNEYYMQFDRMNTNLSNYISDGSSEIKTRLFETIQELENSMAGLQELNVSPAFQRDIKDISLMMGQYEKRVRAIAEKTTTGEEGFSSSVYRELLDEYEKAENIYERIDAEFKPLHLQLLSKASERQSAVMKKSRLYYAVFLLLVLLLSAYGIWWGKRLSSWILLPIQTLTHAAEDIRDGRLSEFRRIDFREHIYEEGTLLIQVFNMMAQQIKSQIKIIEEDAKTKVLYQKQKVEKLKILNLLRTSELKSLQMQMNPHFLFNTLNMIAKTAYIEEAEKTVFLLKKTSQLLRYSLDYMGKSVTLGQELESLGNYVYLQEQRFGKRILFEFDLDESFHQTKIPCLILQPLVENSIIHGVGAFVEGGRVLIQTKYEQKSGRGLIRIADNGCGMDGQTLALVRERLSSDEEQREKLGLATVCRRLQIFFEERANMEIRSTALKGTAVEIMVPVKERDEENVENSDCR